MTRTKVHLDRVALERVLRRREVGEAVGRLGGEIADKIRSQGIEVNDRDGGPAEFPLPVMVFVGEDATGAVALSHPSGLAVQAKHGPLTKAAAALGLEVHG